MMIHVYCTSGFADDGHRDWIELPDDWDEMNAEDQQEYLDDTAKDFMANHIECGAYVVEKQGDR